MWSHISSWALFCRYRQKRGKIIAFFVVFLPLSAKSVIFAVENKCKLADNLWIIYQ